MPEDTPHLRDFTSFHQLVVLNNAERIYPEVLDFEFPAYLYRIEYGLRNIHFRYSGKHTLYCMLSKFDRLLRHAPNITECGEGIVCIPFGLDKFDFTRVSIAYVDQVCRQRRIRARFAPVVFQDTVVQPHL